MASPKANYAEGANLMKGLAFPSISIVNDVATSSQAPECSICSERYDDSEEDLIPRNLACGHSMCSSE